MEPQPDETYFTCEEDKSPIQPKFKSAHARVYDNRLLIAMVGLPARGKTHISRKLTRYLTWMGYNAKVFNIGDKRRKVLGVEGTAKADFFRPDNEEALKQREQLAEDTLAEVVKFLNHSTGNIAIFDGTNTTKKRRKKILHVLNTYLPDTEFFFLEMICNDAEQIEKNLRKAKLSSPDFVGWKEDQIIDEFKERIHQYEAVYEEVGCANYDLSPGGVCQRNDPEQHVPFIKIINNNERLISQNIQWFLNLQIMTFLLHLHLEERPFYLLRHGESEFNLEDRIGGDPSLSVKGQAFAKLLNKFFEEEKKTITGDKFIVNTSTLKRTIETAEFLDNTNEIFDIKTPLKILDEIHAGICDSLTYSEIEEKYPEISEGRKQDKMGFRYPKGESYYDVINRVQSYIVELESIKTPTIVIAHNAIIR